jgi:hypothetical protein
MFDDFEFDEDELDDETTNYLSSLPELYNHGGLWFGPLPSGYSIVEQPGCLTKPSRLARLTGWRCRP